jgi:teichuronic acid biosynthesis glycosyltransferase TuaG
MYKNQNMTDLVSIITPTYNSSKHVEKTIDSILNQTYSAWELLITDDGSIDETLEILKKYSENDERIKVFSLRNNLGPAFSRNNSIQMAKGRFIAFCDSDDVWLPNKLEIQIKFMIENQISFSYSNYDEINEDSVFMGNVKCPEIVDYKMMIKNCYIGCLTVVYDTEYFGKINMPLIRKRQDWGLWLDLLKRTQYAYNVGHSLALYRKRSSSISSNKLKVIKYNWLIYRKIEKFSVVKSFYKLLMYFLFYFKKRH